MHHLGFKSVSVGFNCCHQNVIMTDPLHYRSGNYRVTWFGPDRVDYVKSAGQGGTGVV